jgi:hypothetical protein
MTGSSITYHHRQFAVHILTYKEAFLRYVCNKGVISLLFPLYRHFMYKEYIKLRKEIMSMQSIRLTSQLNSSKRKKKIFSRKHENIVGNGDLTCDSQYFCLLFHFVVSLMKRHIYAPFLTYGCLRVIFLYLFLQTSNFSYLASIKSISTRVTKP